MYRIESGVEILKGTRNIPVYYIWFSLYHSYEYIKSRSSFLGMYKIAIHDQSVRSKAAGGSAHWF